MCCSAAKAAIGATSSTLTDTTDTPRSRKRARCRFASTSCPLQKGHQSAERTKNTARPFSPIRDLSDCGLPAWSMAASVCGKRWPTSGPRILTGLSVDPDAHDTGNSSTATTASFRPIIRFSFPVAALAVLSLHAGLSMRLRSEESLAFLILWTRWSRVSSRSWRLGRGQNLGVAPQGAAVAKVRDVRREEHCPVPLEEQTRLASQRGNAEEVKPAPHEPRNETRQLESQNFRHRIIVSNR